MSKVLYVLASPRKGRSKSIMVADAFIEAYLRKNPDDELCVLNVFNYPLPSFDGATVEAKYKIMHGKEHTPEELDAWRDVEDVIERFTTADKYVFAIAMWNFSIPYRLKQYIDILVQPGYTFTVDENGESAGLVKGKPALVVYSRGGAYLAPNGAEAYDFQKPYIEQILGYMGIVDIRSIVVEPTLQQGPDVAEEARRQAIIKARELAEEF